MMYFSTSVTCPAKSCENVVDVFFEAERFQTPAQATSITALFAAIAYYFPSA